MILVHPPCCVTGETGEERGGPAWNQTPGHSSRAFPAATGGPSPLHELTQQVVGGGHQFVCDSAPNTGCGPGLGLVMGRHQQGLRALRPCLLVLSSASHLTVCLPTHVTGVGHPPTAPTATTRGAVSNALSTQGSPSLPSHWGPERARGMSQDLTASWFIPGPPDT